jgi:hypothetical protein
MTAGYCCPACWQVVGTYTPTGTNVLVVMPHDWPRSPGHPCSGGHEAALTQAFVDRERAANAAWRAGLI